VWVREETEAEADSETETDAEVGERNRIEQGELRGGDRHVPPEE
jgi:hypothetical protein